MGCGSVAPVSRTICLSCAEPLTAYRHLVLGKKGNAIIVGFVDHGIADKVTIKEIEEELSDLADRRQKHDLVLDFSGVVGVSSTMLETLLAIELSVEKEGRDLRLCKVGAEVRTLMASKELDHMFCIEEDRMHASNAVSRDRTGGNGAATQ